MSKLTPQQSIKGIYQILFELATGNLSVRLEKTAYPQELYPLADQLNSIAGQMQNTLLNYEYVSPRYTYQNLVQFTAIVNVSHCITNCVSVSKNIFGYEASQLIGQPFKNLLTSQSAEVYDLKVNEASKDTGFTVAHLIFITPQNLLAPRFCSISILYSGEIIISAVTTILQDLVHDLPRLRKIHEPKVQPSEAETMQKLYDYILANLDKPLPTLKQLAKIYKLNEFDLKHGFRTNFQTSIHKFYNEERLKQAHLMITNTAISLKAVAIANGFSDYTTFYKSFKKYFGYSPGQLDRQPSPHNDTK